MKREGNSQLNHELPSYRPSALRLLLAMLCRTNFHFLNNCSIGTTIGFFNRDEATSPCVTTFLYGF